MTQLDLPPTSTKNTPAPRPVLLTALLALTAFVILQAAYAVKLNELFYSHYGPFYDSLSYYQKLAIDMAAARTDGLPHGLDAASSNTTVCLPFIEGVLLAKWMPPSRALGVWLQTLWVAALAASLFYYLVKCRRAHPTLALAFILPILSIDAIYSYNGGLSDFRMDLHLYLLTALAAVWHLVTYHTPRLWPWLFCGCAIGASCLSRATTPIYVAMMLGPLILARLIFGSNLPRWRVVLYAAATLCTAALLSAWFYIKSWTFIHFYYFVWNAAANAHIPLRQALGHFRLAWLNLGTGTAALALALMALSLPYAALRQQYRGHWLRLLRLIDWKLLYLGLAPILMLVAMRARLDAALPSMPAAFGLLLFFLLPLRIDLPRKSPLYHTLALVLSLTVCTALALRGLDNNLHQDATATRIEVYERSLRILETDAARQGKHEIRYVAPYLGTFLGDALTNVMIYDHGYTCYQGKAAKGRLQVRLDVPLAQFCTAMPADWALVPGNSDDDKISFLANLAKEKIDYVFLPDEPTTEWLETYIRCNYSNVFIRRLKDRLLAQGCWTPISEPLAACAAEHIVIYRNTAKTTGGMDPIDFLTPPADLDTIDHQGIDADGWINQDSSFTVPEGFKIKGARLHLELPPWSGLPANALTVTVNNRALLNISLDQGKTEVVIPIDEREGPAVIQLHAGKTFPIPAPDTRHRAFRILKMEFQTN